MERLTAWKLEAARLWRNGSIRRLVCLLAAASVLAAAGVWIYASVSADRLQRQWLAQETAYLGRLTAEDPALAERWASLLANPEAVTEADRARGSELAREYGLTDAIRERLAPGYASYFTWTWQWLGGGALLLAVLVSVLLLRQARRQLTDIRNLAVSLENAVKHNRPMAFRVYGEGEFGLLAGGVQELAIRLQETIGQLQRDKAFLKDTVADISHQLKTPLASVAMYTDLLRERSIEPRVAAEFLDTCRRELDRMEWLIQTLLKLARLEADALSLQIVPARMADTIDRALAAVRRLAEERDVAIDVSAPGREAGSVGTGTGTGTGTGAGTGSGSGEGEREVPHDSRWLAEAIANLLKNAVEHSPHGARVEVRQERTPVFWRLSVQDHGPGIEERHLPHVFRKFYRASRSGSGVGLGLPLARSIAERHGGMLTVVSRPGEGARFVLTLPLHPLPAADQPPILTNL